VSHSPIQPAELSWNEQGTPVSRHFDDVYFSNQNGLLETRHVFLNGNGFPERFTEHPRPVCVVAETGFGTGLNFLTLWQAFDAFRQQTPDAPLKRLHFISFEKFPLSSVDLTAALARWPELAGYAAQLTDQWPLPFSGCHRLLLDGGRVTLDLWFGDVTTLLPACDSNMNQQIDAWFLDGFAPSKNPDMWTADVFSNMARLSRATGTLATFTVAGFVRRGLLDAGFDVRKVKGFGEKKHMLSGVMNNPQDVPHPAPWYRRPAAEKTTDIGIIGGGVASAVLALALLRRNYVVTLYCADEQPARGASGNRQGAVYPLLNGRNDVLERFFAHAFTFARRQYQAIAAQGVPFDHQWCGVSQLAYDEKSQGKIDKILEGDWPSALATGLSQQALTAAVGLECGNGGIQYPLGGWLCPAQLTAELISLAEKQGLTVHFNERVKSLQWLETERWQMDFTDGKTAQHDSVVLANGADITDFTQSAMLPVYAVSGQVSHIPTTPTLQKLKQVLCYDGYMTPENPLNQHHCIGASYHRADKCTEYREDDQQQNRQRLIDCLPAVEWPKEVDVSAGEARNGVRCATRDHLPMVGAVANYAAMLAEYKKLDIAVKRNQPVADAPCHRNLFLLGALGSRGLSSAPLAAEVLAAQIAGEPMPADSETLAALNPNRMWIRKLIKGKPVIQEEI